ncbi:asialoglycoprotein receptor 1-like [Chanodichthys erythropterus]|uniref:asialoglycoprotein receptor 1-like n=1 Tax=Chanodichthys erythropterus TaxID=933992 RepID=UPI00351ECCF4
MDSKRPKIYKRTHGNSSPEIQDLDREDGEEMITDANRDTQNHHEVRTETENSDTAIYQTLQHSGSVCVRIRSSRAAPVCLVLLCVLLLTAVIVLAIKLTQTVDEFYIKYKNITEEIDELRKRKTILEENTNNLSNYNETLNTEKLTLQKEMKELRQRIHKIDGWSCYQSSLYFISSEKKSWTESRRYCTDRGADLIIINNTEEQEYLKQVPGGTDVWIGLTDSDVDNTWKWVDGTNMTSGFWRDGAPSDSAGDKDCAINLPSGFADYSCKKPFKWICEKNTS